MSFSSWGTSLRQAVSSVTASGLMSLASVATVAISLLVLSVVVLLAVNVEVAARTVESQFQARAWLRPDLNPTPAEGEALAGQVRQLDGVKEARFVSKAEALEEMRRSLGPLADVFTELPENPLPASLIIEVHEIERLPEVAARVGQMPGVERVDYGEGLLEDLMAVTRALRLGGAGLVLLLLTATVLTIANTIRLAVFARRREVAIMKLVGATDGFIRRPFLLEGIFLGTAGAGLAMLGTATGYRYLVNVIQTRLPFWPMVPPAEILPDLTFLLLALGALLGAVGSAISLRRFLKV